MEVIDQDTAIFNAAQYVLDIPELDGYKAEKLIVSVSGGVELDRTSESDLAFVNGLELGREVELRVTATVSKKGFGYSLGKEDEPGQTGYQVGLRVHSVEVA